MEYALSLPDGSTVEGNLEVGEMKLIPLAGGQQATVKLDPTRDFDVGKGKGVPLESTVVGGTVGVILDGRGRPLEIPVDAGVRVPLLKQWMTALNVYDAAAWEG